MADAAAWAQLEGALNVDVAGELFAPRGPSRPHRPAWLSLILAFWTGGRFWKPAARIALTAVPLVLHENLGDRYVPLAFIFVIAADVWLQQ